MSGTPNLFFDTKNNVFFERNVRNIVYEASRTQLPPLHGVAVADLFMSKGHMREPHWHPNAAELDLMVSGEVSISILDPITPQLVTYDQRPGQVVFIPMGWWHWITALTDEVHDIVIFANDQPQSVEGSDVLRLTPPQVFAQAYSIDPEQLAQVLAPINQTVVIGPVGPELRRGPVRPGGA